MPNFGKPRHAWAVLGAATLTLAAAPMAASAQIITALPDQTSAIRLSNRDVNHLVCEGGEIEDVKFSAEKGLAVEKAGADAWVKFLVRESDDAGNITRTYVTSPSEFFVTCNGAIYPLYAEPSDIPAQTVRLVAGASQRARANAELLGPLVEEERAVSITLSLLADRVPASFSEIATRREPFLLPDTGGMRMTERRRVAVEGAGLSASEYLVEPSGNVTLDERWFLNSSLGARIFAVTIDRLSLKAGESARLVIIRRGETE